MYPKPVCSVHYISLIFASLLLGSWVAVADSSYFTQPVQIAPVRSLEIIDLCEI